MSTAAGKQQTPQAAKPATQTAVPSGAGELVGLATSFQLGQLPDDRTSRALRQTAVQNMQQKYGNTAVLSRLPAFHPALIRQTPQANQIAREDEEDVNTGLDASMLTVNMTTPPLSGGKVTISKQGDGPGGTVTLTAPEISYTADASLASGVKLGSDNGVIKVGPVQTMISSVRTGVYQKGNQIVAEMSQNLSMVRDARPLRYAGDSSKSTFAAESPFYDRPSGITDMAPSQTVNFIDRPKFELPVEFGGGRLVAVKGADEFNTSVGAKREGVGVITMNPFAWKVDWNLNLTEDYSIKKDKDGNPIANEIFIWEETRGIVIDSDTYARELAQNTPYIFSFKTVAAAMTESVASLWAALLPARQHDPASAKNIEAALRAKNPSFAVKLTVDKTATWGSDTIGLFASAAKQTGMQGPFALDEGESQTVTFKLNDLIDPGDVTSQSQLRIWAGGHGDEAILGDFLALSHPFTGSGSITVTDADGDTGEYFIEVKMA